MAAASWGAGDFCGGIAARLGNTVVASWVAQATGLVVATVLLVIASEPPPSTVALLEAGLAGVAGAVGLLGFYLALSRGTMGLVAPLTALIAAAVPAVIGVATGESSDPVVLSGMVVALAAVVIITLPEGGAGGPSIPRFGGSRARELGLIAFAGLGFATFFLLVDRSHESGGETWWPLLMTKLGGTAFISLAGLGLIAIRRMPGTSHPRGAVRVAILAGFGDLGGNLFFVMATDVGELAVVVVLASLYPVATSILAWRFLHERLGRVRLAGVALALVGIVLIGLGSA